MAAGGGESACYQRSSGKQPPLPPLSCHFFPSFVHLRHHSPNPPTWCGPHGGPCTPPCARPSLPSLLPCMKAPCNLFPICSLIRSTNSFLLINLLPNLFPLHCADEAMQLPFVHGLPLWVSVALTNSFPMPFPSGRDLPPACLLRWRAADMVTCCWHADACAAAGSCIMALHSPVTKTIPLNHPCSHTCVCVSDDDAHLANRVM